MEFLIESGAEVNAIDRYSATPRDDAVRNAYPEISNILIRAGAHMPATSLLERERSTAPMDDKISLLASVKHPIVLIIGFFQVAMIILHSLFTNYTLLESLSSDSSLYPVFQGIIYSLYIPK